MEPIIKWVDSGPPSPEKPVSPRRTVKLFLAVLACAILGGIPFFLLEIGPGWFESSQKEHELQEKLQKDVKALEQAIKNGKGGEATKRLFGVENRKKFTQK